MAVGLSADQLKALRAAQVQLDNIERDIAKLERVRGMDVSAAKAELQRARETATDLIREFGVRTPGAK